MRTILSLFPGLMSGRRLADEGELQQLVQLLFSTQAGIEGSGTPPGPVLNAAINQVVGSGLHVQLPVALAGRQVIVVNATTSDMAVHVQTSNSANNNLPDTIDGTAVGDIPLGLTAMFISYMTGVWTEVLTVAPPPPP